MIRTLIVDDDVRVADLHRLYTEQVGGFEVVGIARTGAEVLRLADRLRPDLILLDVYLPDMSGLEVLRRLRDAGLEVDVITITAARDVATLRSALQGGSVYYLIKPFTFEAFRERLQSYAVVRQRLADGQETTQDEVDRLLGLLRASPDGELPKGLSAATRDLVLEAVRSSRRALSAADVARMTGLSRVTARRYLEHLARVGLVELSMRYGTPGRPAHHYQGAEPGARRAGPEGDG
ncbi:MAG TPA: response regulator, partial [Candidatus Limnocylindrales bacterium]|nr:response regulator [Candidatus Limnocylindrales bacterium]